MFTRSTPGQVVFIFYFIVLDLLWKNIVHKNIYEIDGNFCKSVVSSHWYFGINQSDILRSHLKHAACKHHWCQRNNWQLCSLCGRTQSHQRFSLLKAGVGQNIAVRALPAVRNFFLFVVVVGDLVHSTSFILDPLTTFFLCWLWLMQVSVRTHGIKWVTLLSVTSSYAK